MGGWRVPDTLRRLQHSIQNDRSIMWQGPDKVIDGEGANIPRSPNVHRHVESSVKRDKGGDLCHDVIRFKLEYRHSLPI